MKWLVLILPFLMGCAAIQEQGEAQQDRELANNRAEVTHAVRELCQQIRAATLEELFPGPALFEWHSFCEYRTTK